MTCEVESVLLRRFTFLQRFDNFYSALYVDIYIVDYILRTITLDIIIKVYQKLCISKLL